MNNEEGPQSGARDFQAWLKIWVKSVRDRLEAATPGPWTSGRDLMTFQVYTKKTPGVQICKLEDNDYGTHDDKEFLKRYRDSDLIASAPTDLALCLEIIEKQAEALSIISKDDPCAGYLAQEAQAAVLDIIQGKERK